MNLIGYLESSHKLLSSSVLTHKSPEIWTTSAREEVSYLNGFKQWITIRFILDKTISRIVRQQTYLHISSLEYDTGNQKQFFPDVNVEMISWQWKYLVKYLISELIKIFVSEELSLRRLRFQKCSLSIIDAAICNKGAPQHKNYVWK